MTTIDSFLDQATHRLISRIADTMEELNVDPARIAELRAALDTTKFPANWPSFLLDVQDALYHTAYSRYHVWQHTKGKGGKGKGKGQRSPSEPTRSSKRSTLSIDTSRRNPSSSQDSAHKSSGKKKKRVSKRIVRSEINFIDTLQG